MEYGFGRQHLMALQSDLAGLVVLVVEDDVMVSMLAEDVLTEAGAEVLLAMQPGAAMDIAQRGAVDAAVLDVNLGEGRTSYPIADLLCSRGVPFLFLTGYGENGVDDRFGDTATLRKPYAPHDLVEAVGAIARQCGDLRL